MMISRDSAEWPGLRAWLQLRIETHRLALESENCGIKEADHLRGRIMEDRELIATVEPQIIPFTAPAGDRARTGAPGY